MEKVAIVTGGAKGIGYGSSLRLLEDGAHVIAFDRDTAALAQAEKDSHNLVTDLAQLM